jgi:hypothetical protein
MSLSIRASETSASLPTDPASLDDAARKIAGVLEHPPTDGWDKVASHSGWESVQPSGKDDPNEGPRPFPTNVNASNQR